MRYRNVVVAAAVTGLSAAFVGLPAGPAAAQPLSGPYISAGAGLHIPLNPDVSFSGFGGRTNRTLELQEGVGFNSQAAVGYGLGNGFRFEIEGDFLRNSLTGISGTRVPLTASGTVRTYGVMANALFDLDIGSRWVFPYLGGGVGYQWTNFNSVSIGQSGGQAGGQTGGLGGFTTNGTSGAFAWQAILGAAFPVPNVPGLSLTADYRFMGILSGDSFSGGTGRTGFAAAGGPGGGAMGASLKLQNQYNNEMVFGIRYAFNTPRPPAPAPVEAPAPAPASRSYLVFFDWDKATLTDRARQIIKEAAHNSTRVQVTRIEVNGYTDTSGSPQYNQGLSVRRAQAVAGELVKDGVPKSVITIQGFGETNPLVPTGPNVREPQNRRVEIIIK